MASTCNSFSSSFRCEVTTLAAIYVAFKESGIMVRSISDLVRMVLELTHEKLEASGKLRPITDYREAIEVLAELRITQRNLSGQNIVRRLQSESLREDGFDLDYLTRVKSKSRPKAQQEQEPDAQAAPTSCAIPFEQAAEIMEKIRQRDKELQQQKAVLGQLPIAED